MNVKLLTRREVLHTTLRLAILSVKPANRTVKHLNPKQQKAA